MKIEQLKAGEEDEDALFGSDTPLADQKVHFRLLFREIYFMFYSLGSLECK